MKQLDMDPAMLEQAAEWMLQVQAGQATAVELEEIQLWRQQNADHELAWSRAERFLGSVQSLPVELGAAVLSRAPSASRRSAIKKLGALLLIGPAAWMGYRSVPSAPYGESFHTATGEQRNIVLADGSRVSLNSSTRVDIDYSSTQRLLRLLEGEIHIVTAPDVLSPSRPFLVQTQEVSARALGTRFTVRQLPQQTHVAVYEHAVEVSSQGSATARTVIHAGQQGSFFNSGFVAPTPIILGQDAWLDGMYVARNQTLRAVLDEFQRHQRMIVRCHPEVANLRVSGIFSLTDIDKNFNVLQGSLPIHVSRLSKYWVTISPSE